jgi:hypothetical protein
MLRRKPAFMGEFEALVLGQAHVHSAWNGLWLAFAVETSFEWNKAPLPNICDDRVALVQSLAPEETSRLFLSQVNSALMPLEPPTTGQLKDFEESAAGCTPADIIKFVARVRMRVHTRLDLSKSVALSDSIRHLRPRMATNVERSVVAITWRDVESAYETERDDGDGTCNYTVKKHGSRFGL